MLFRSAPALIAVVGLLSVAAQAGELEQKSVSVGYADLNLLSPAGHAALMARIDHAIKEACGPAGPELQRQQAFRACRQEAMNQAMPAAHAAFAAAQAQSQMAAGTEPAGRNATR